MNDDKDLKEVLSSSAFVSEDEIRRIADGLKKHKYLHVYMQESDPGHDAAILNPDGSVTEIGWSTLTGSDLNMFHYPSVEAWAKKNGDEWWLAAADSEEGAASDGPDAEGGPISEEEMDIEMRNHVSDDEEGEDDGFRL